MLRMPLLLDWRSRPQPASAVIAGSGVFSTLLSELAGRRYLGTALTTRTALGFLLTIVTVRAIPLTAAVTGWRCAFLALAAGPMTALPALTVLSRQIRPNELVSATQKGHRHDILLLARRPARDGRDRRTVP